MQGSSAPPVDASTRLLRVLTSFTAQLDPVKGVGSKMARRAAEDVDDIVEDYGTSLSSDICQLLASATSSLSPSSTSTVPYSTCLSAHLSLARALSLLADSPHTRTSSFSRLPAELVDRIVELCRGDDDDGDMRLRQNTNLVLASTCRTFHRSVQPILRREVHLFTPGQLERLAESLCKRERDVAAVTTCTISLALSDIKLRKDGRWAGAHLVQLLQQLHNVEVLQVEFEPELGEDETASNLEVELSDALGFASEDWRELYDNKPPLRRLSVSAFSEDHLAGVDHLLLKPPPCLSRLVVGHRDYPADLGTLFPPFSQSTEREREQRYTHLLLPWLAIRPSHLLDLVRPFSNIAPQLRHLETFLVFLHDLQTTISAIEELFGGLAPTLQTFILRLDTDQDWDWQREAGQHCLWTDFPVNLSELHPPNLRSIVFLVRHAFGGMVDYAHKRPRSVETATLYIPSPEWAVEENFVLPQLHGAIAVYAEQGLMLSLAVRRREANWWDNLA